MSSNKPIIPNVTSWRALQQAVRTKHGSREYHHFSIYGLTRHIPGDGCPCQGCAAERVQLLEQLEKECRDEQQREIDLNCPQRAARFYNELCAEPAGGNSGVISTSDSEPDQKLNEPIFKMQPGWVFDEEKHEQDMQQIRNDSLYGKAAEPFRDTQWYLEMRHLPDPDDAIVFVDPDEDDDDDSDDDDDFDDTVYCGA